MAQNQTTPQRLYDLLVTRGFDPVTKDPNTGKDIAPGEAKIIKFDYKGSSGKDYGTAVLILGDDQQLQLFFGDSMGKSMEDQTDKDEWFEFLHQLAQFSVRNGFNTFTPLNINQLKHYQAGMAAIREGLFEGYYGTRQVSYMGEATQARLMIRHKRPLGEHDARYRQIQALFIETQDGERFRLPFENLMGGRAMLEHVRQGGRPYDIRGAHISNMVTEAKVLSRFRRASQGRMLEGVTQEVASRADVYYQNLRENLRSLATSRGYSNYFETWTPDEAAQSDALVEDLKNLFVEQTLDQRIEQALPVLARIQGSAMKEAEIFENWINQVAEGADDLASNRNAQRRLQELLSQPELPVGAEGMNVIPELEDIIGYDANDEKDNEDFEQLKDRLITLSVENSADADAREIIKAWLEEKGIDVGDAKIDDQGTASEPAPEPTPEPAPEPAPAAAPVPAQPPAQPPVAEGDNLATFVGPNESREAGGLTADQLDIGDEVIVTGPIRYKGATGVIVEFGQDKRFVVVNLYNHGRHSFQSSDVEFNEYAGSDEELGHMGEDSTDAMDHRGAVTDSFYEDLARIKTLALSK